MKSERQQRRPILFILKLSLYCLSLLWAHAAAFGQEPTGTRQEQEPDVLRINTELVQTDVMVFDKSGRFVDNLQREQFELRVDGKPQPISFFERVKAGTEREERVRSGGASGGTTPPPTSGNAVERGRTVIFFIDDYHLSLQSVGRTRELLQHFIEKEMGNGDVAVISTASGQIGFLEQFTDNREVLRAAASRLTYRPYVVRGYGTGSTQMSEYMAYTIDTKSDRDVLGVFVQECMKQTPIPKKNKGVLESIRVTCETQVKNSARGILLQAASITESTYRSFQNLIRSSARLPGRKLTFFISDGFLLDAGPRGSSLIDRLQQTIDAAQRSSVVVYTIDARGLISGLPDATSNLVDPSGRLESATLREIAATQDALHALAVETGGRALRNQNVFDRWVTKMLDETSNYYLLAWRPESEAQRERKFRHIQVSIAGRPDLTVRLPRGYFEGPKETVATRNASLNVTENRPTNTSSQKPPDVELRDALTDFYTRGSLPTVLSLNYLNTPANATVLTSSIQIATQSLNYGADEKQPASVSLAGVILNDKGKVVTGFKSHLNVNPLQATARPEMSGVIYNHRAPLEPGIYQVRVVARDDTSGRLGSAMQWVVIPELKAGRLTLSSLLLGGQVIERSGARSATTNNLAQTATGANATTDPQVQFSVDKRFSRSSHLSFWVFIYNAARKGGGQPELTAQVQVFKGSGAEPIISTPQRRLQTNTMSDLGRIPYAGEFPLSSLAPGRYTLQVTVTDMAANASASQRSYFEVQ